MSCWHRASPIRSPNVTAPSSKQLRPYGSSTARTCSGGGPVRCMRFAARSSENADEGRVRHPALVSLPAEQISASEAIVSDVGVGVRMTPWSEAAPEQQGHEESDGSNHHQHHAHGVEVHAAGCHVHREGEDGADRYPDDADADTHCQASLSIQLMT